jgi:hypothetical protein
LGGGELISSTKTLEVTNGFTKGTSSTERVTMLDDCFLTGIAIIDEFTIIDVKLVLRG